MGTSSDDVRGYIAGLEVQAKDLAEVRVALDKHRKGVTWHDTTEPHRNETDAEVIARMSAWERTVRCLEGDVAYWKEKATMADAIVKRGLHDTEARANGIRLGLRAAALLASDHDCGDEHDARLDALAMKILGTSAEEAKSMVEAYDESARAVRCGVHRAPGKDGPWEVGEPVLDHLGREVGKVALYTTSKPCPLKDCDLPCDDGHKHLVEKTDEPRPAETMTIPGPKRVKLRVGQIWRLPAGGERQITGDLWSGIPGSVSLGGASIGIDQNNYVTDTGGCTLVYDPRGTQ